MLLNCVLFFRFWSFFKSVSVSADKLHSLRELPRMGTYEICHSSERTLPTLLFSDMTESSAGSFSAPLLHIVLVGISCLHIPLWLWQCALSSITDQTEIPNPACFNCLGSSCSEWRCLMSCSIFSPWLKFLRRSLIHDALEITVETHT